MKAKFNKHLNAALNSRRGGTAGGRVCGTTRYRPLGFRVSARPGRRPRFAHRGAVKNERVDLSRAIVCD